MGEYSLFGKLRRAFGKPSADGPPPLASRPKQGTVRKVVLSFGVVDTAAVETSGSSLVAEYVFDQLREWSRKIVLESGGTIRSVLRDGMAAQFEEPAAGANCVMRLLRGMPEFNAVKNRLPVPIVLRCGLCEGDLLDGTAFQGPGSDRAAALQKKASPGTAGIGREIEAACLTVFGDMKPYPWESENALSWAA